MRKSYAIYEKCLPFFSSFAGAAPPPPAAATGAAAETATPAADGTDANFAFPKKEQIVKSQVALQIYVEFHKS